MNNVMYLVFCNYLCLLTYALTIIFLILFMLNELNNASTKTNQYHTIIRKTFSVNKGANNLIQNLVDLDLLFHQFLFANAPLPNHRNVHFIDTSF